MEADDDLVVSVGLPLLSPQRLDEVLGVRGLGRRRAGGEGYLIIVIAGRNASETLRTLARVR